MADKDEKVYSAKLAEQAERYDGKKTMKRFWYRVNVKSLQYRRLLGPVLGQSKAKVAAFAQDAPVLLFQKHQEHEVIQR